jgi:hypothetical protein
MAVIDVENGASSFCPKLSPYNQAEKVRRNSTEPLRLREIAASPS